MPNLYFNPVRTVHGPGALSCLSGLLAGRRAVLVTFPEARALGLVARVEALLGDRLLGVLDDVRPNPDVAELAAIYEAHRRGDDRVEAIVAMGGGSVIDTAKVLAVGSADGRFERLFSALRDGIAMQPAHVQPVIAVPTTAGTGSEVTPWATVWDRARGRKYSLHLDETWPEAAILDPELMRSLPASVTLQSGLDALSHALEAIWNVHANPVSDTFAVSAVHEVMDALPRLMVDLDDIDLRSRLALAALKAGMAFSNTRTALAHSISYEMTLRHGLPHGIACSFPLPMVLERALGHSADRDAVLARALGPLGSAPSRLTTFIENLGVKTRFADYGIGPDEADAMVAQALTGARGRNFIGQRTETTA